MSSSSSTPHRSYPNPRNRYQPQQQRYVPKPSKPDTNISATPLTTSLRASSSSSSSSSASSKAETKPSTVTFVNYLPQDEALASGFAPDVGGSDPMESQRVVDVLNDGLSRLLKLNAREFWKEVSRNDSLHEFLDSYLQFRHRWYDFPPRGAKGMVTGVIVGELELSRRVFMVLYRMSSNRDPGASPSDCLSMKDHTALLQEKKLLDLPKLLDICAIYGHENGELTKSLVTNAIKAQPKILGNSSAVVSHFLSIVHTMHERCSSSVEVLMSSGEQEGHRHEQLNQDFLEVMDFLNDAIVTLDAFADAFKPAALYFSISFDMSYGSEELLGTLAKLHDSLLPSLQQGVTLTSRGVESQNSGSELQNISLSLKMLSMRIVNLGWKLLDFCYLCDEPIEDTLLQTTTQMFPAKVEDPAIRGDIITQTLREINKEALYLYQEKSMRGTFLQNLENSHKILYRIDRLRSCGWIFMDEDQFQYLTQIATPPYMQTWDKVPKEPIAAQSITMPHVDEDAIVLESKISQIKDIFPDYGKGFLSACLVVYNHNPEEVIQRILEGTLHEDLLSLDTSLEQIPPSASASASASHNRNDKGKGLLVTESALPASKDLIANRRDEKPLTTSSSSSASSYGRFTRKSNEDKLDSQTLDSLGAMESVRSAILAAELEYEDEYDDSFDDLGLTVETGYEETENSSISKSVESGNSGSRWGQQKKPQFYVKDGKNYSYKVSGSIAVSNANDAAVINQAQRETIHGLGRGGNLPLGAVKKLMDANEQDNQSGTSETFDRGGANNRGRGGRRGGGGGGGRNNHYRKDRAMKKHFQGLGGS